MSADGKKMLVARMLRAFCYGYVAVVLALYLEGAGMDPVQIGVLLTSAVAGATAMTVVWSVVADRYGRRRTVATMALLMAVGGIIFALTDNFWLLLLGTFTGTISPTSSEVGSFVTVEQAVLPQTAPEERRTWLFSVYNMLGSLAAAAGSLFSGVVGVFAGLGLSGSDAYRPLFVLYAVIGVANLLLFLSLSEQVELARVEGNRRFIGIHRSRGAVAKLSLLLGLDAFAGGFVVQPFVAYWFHVQWGLAVDALGVVFFWAGVLSAISFLASGWLAPRVGLVNTMVFTHFPSNVMLLLVPLAPTASLAVALYILRNSVSWMDVPARQSYIMAIVDLDERTATAGITSVARSAASGISPLLTGIAMSAAATSLPFFLGGGLKIIYNGLLFVAFRNVRAPEEEAKRVAIPDSRPLAPKT